MYYLLFLATLSVCTLGEEALLGTAVKLEAVAPPKLPEVPKLPDVPVAKEASAAVPSVPALAATEVVAPAEVAAASPENVEEAAKQEVAPPEMQYNVESLQQDATENSDSLRVVPMVGALLSFGALLTFTMVFLMKVIKPRKGQGHGSNSKPKPAALSDELDFDDLEGALGLPPSPTNSTPKRKTVQSEECTNVAVHQEETEVSANGWANNLESDAGWGEDGWADESWDDTDFEAPADMVEVAMGVHAQPRPAPPRKGKAD